jgi:hypothetical protein
VSFALPIRILPHSPKAAIRKPCKLCLFLSCFLSRSELTSSRIYSLRSLIRYGSKSM